MMLEDNEESKKRGRGRPRVETRLPEGWKEIIEEAGMNGKHITDFLIILGISWDAHWSLMDRNYEYNRAVKHYEKLCENWWFEKARQSMDETEGAGFNTRLFSLIMRNKFPKNWSESTKVDVTTQGDKIENKPISIEIVRPKND